MSPNETNRTAKRRLDFADGPDASAAPKRKLRSSSPSPVSSNTDPSQTQLRFSPRTQKARPTATPTRRTPSRSVVTPDAPKPRPVAVEYVPRYLHQTLDYQRRGQKKDLPTHTRTALALIEQYYEIPANLEQSRKYGPLSGTTYEELVLQAYTLGTLAVKKEDGAIVSEVDICTECAVLGHRRGECPTLL
ncbi:predicted protein [Phaeodactylum tricornutum CCAP 1055/1]|jgi:hypothetical protein|uniref:Uncharacterized protein n=1 Tax=Phaeodactylum tricornutum (strain CCAP 1055/1) TaxID=556484 RepID=B7G3Y6_PHATC|nr:predicted protein [Phaeodactylum tricornutum CCAP 1055/1]EEC46903.1 predicted protein [Phaeodactylum tricornutum CCAP 1055/1]|eukprot:XP_002181689.1 predicted protein [Phaeodactylum tricornutum CCAP 1055/1]